MVVAGSQRMGPICMPGTMQGCPEALAPKSAMPPLFPLPPCRHTKDAHPFDNLLDDVWHGRESLQQHKSCWDSRAEKSTSRALPGHPGGRGPLWQAVPSHPAHMEMQNMFPCKLQQALQRNICSSAFCDPLTKPSCYLLGKGRRVIAYRRGDWQQAKAA
jgi:hypothetical protein